MALATVLLLAPWVAEAQSGGAAPVFTEGASASRNFNETVGDAANGKGTLPMSGRWMLGARQAARPAGRRALSR